VSERSRGTVREDYSPNGAAWEHLSDDAAILVFGLALWNGNDPILKERAFGLTPGEGNHEF
jgi:hypothetical protein